MVALATTTAGGGTLALATGTMSGGTFAGAVWLAM
jgi:hypothetical protein